jgi:hypothetical protein
MIMHGGASMLLLALQAAVDSLGTSAVNALGTLVDKVLNYAILLAAVGAVAMALVEALKKLVDVRAKFHAERWTAFMRTNGYTPSPAPHADAYVQLLQLACGVNTADAHEAVVELARTGKPHPKPRLDMRATRELEQTLTSRAGTAVAVPWGHPKAAYSVFAQSTERMGATLGDAADVALSSPDNYHSLFMFLVHGARDDDINTWMEAQESPAVPPPNESIEEKKKRAEAGREAAGALSRLRLVARRKIAAFELFTEQSWASWNQLSANFLGIVIMGLVLYQLNRPALELVFGALFGGVLSPVAKDLVSALQRVKSDIKQSAE